MVVQLNPDEQQRTVLLRTLHEHTVCFNVVTAEGFLSKCSNGVELHKRTYYDLRAQFPDLPSQLVCAARVKATEAVKSALTWAKKREQAYAKRVEKARKHNKPLPVFKLVKCPHSAIAPIRYDQRSSWVKWETNRCSLATVAGRIVLPFTVAAHSQTYAGYRPGSADLCYRKGRFTLHIVVEVPDPIVAPNDTVIGIDLGLNRPAVTSTRQFLGEKRWKEQERKYFRLRRKLQARGTKSAKRHLKRLSGKQLRQPRDHDHVLSKRIVQSTPQGATIVFENLTNIRENSKLGRGNGNKNVENKRKLHRWTFAQLFAFTNYKAQERGIHVERIDPRHTSQTCSRCKHQHRSNRRSQSVFHCRSCGYELNADLNAAYNIRDKFCLASRGTAVGSGSLSTDLSSQPVAG